MFERASKKMRATCETVAMKCQRAYFFHDFFVYFFHHRKKVKACPA